MPGSPPIPPLLLLMLSLGVSRYNIGFSWYSSLDATKWMLNLSLLLEATQMVANALSRKPVLVHCSDGWDRTPQIVSLTQLVLDPYYRTLKVGIVCLVITALPASVVSRVFHVTAGIPNPGGEGMAAVRPQVCWSMRPLADWVGPQRDQPSVRPVAGCGLSAHTTVPHGLWVQRHLLGKCHRLSGLPRTVTGCSLILSGTISLVRMLL